MWALLLASSSVHSSLSGWVGWHGGHWRGPPGQQEQARTIGIAQTRDASAPVGVGRSALEFDARGDQMGVHTIDVGDRETQMIEPGRVRQWVARPRWRAGAAGGEHEQPCLPEHDRCAAARAARGGETELLVERERATEVTGTDADVVKLH